MSLSASATKPPTGPRASLLIAIIFASQQFSERKHHAHVIRFNRCSVTQFRTSVPAVLSADRAAQGWASASPDEFTTIAIAW